MGCNDRLSFTTLVISNIRMNMNKERTKHRCRKQLLFIDMRKLYNMISKEGEE